MRLIRWFWLPRSVPARANAEEVRRRASSSAEHGRGTSRKRFTSFRSGSPGVGPGQSGPEGRLEFLRRGIARLLVVSSAFLALFASSACNDPGSILAVDLRTDYVPSVEWSEVRVFLLRGEREEVQRHSAGANDYIAGQRIGTFGGITPGSYEIRAELLSADRRVIASRTVVVQLASRQSATLLLSRDCAGITCPTDGDAAATECSGGRCVTPECSIESPERCAAGCVADTDCVSVVACASGRCSGEGACLFEPVEGACSSGEYCNPEEGCRVLPGDAVPDDASLGDTGLGDAGLGDAGPAVCGGPCATGNPCEVGAYDCSSGSPVCEATGAGNAGTVCRASVGACDAPEMCDGSSAECPSDEVIPAETECRPGSCLLYTSPSPRD